MECTFCGCIENDGHNCEACGDWNCCDCLESCQSCGGNFCITCLDDGLCLDCRKGDIE